MQIRKPFLGINEQQLHGVTSGMPIPASNGFNGFVKIRDIHPFYSISKLAY